MYSKIVLCLSEKEDEVLFISDDEELLGKAKSGGIATNAPRKMRESYTKAMDLRKQIVGIKHEHTDLWHQEVQ